jgi:leader peptidase (prepilin peptidase)/N-methyltransferase
VTCGIVAAAIGPVPELPAFLVLAAIAVPLALIDLKVLRLPDPLVLAGLVGGVILLTVAALVDGTFDTLLRGGIAAVACGVVYFLIALIPRSQFGFGDVKLGAVLGLYLGWLGWFAVATGIVLAPILNLPLVLGLLATGRAGRRASVPFGPALIAGAFAGVILTALR